MQNAHKALLAVQFGFSMRMAWTSFAILASVGCGSAGAEVAGIRPETCLEIRTAVLRLDAIAAAIQSCTSVIDDKTQPTRIYAEAIAQRGILYARRWSRTDAVRDAHSAIADFSEALRVGVFTDPKIHQLLAWRGSLYEATRQTAKAADDYRAVLRIAPTDERARAGLRRLDAPTN